MGRGWWRCSAPGGPSSRTARPARRRSSLRRSARSRPRLATTSEPESGALDDADLAHRRVDGSGGDALEAVAWPSMSSGSESCRSDWRDAVGGARHTLSIGELHPVLDAHWPLPPGARFTSRPAASSPPPVGELPHVRSSRRPRDRRHRRLPHGRLSPPSAKGSTSSARSAERGACPSSCSSASRRMRLSRQGRAAGPGRADPRLRRSGPRRRRAGRRPAGAVDGADRPSSSWRTASTRLQATAWSSPAVTTRPEQHRRRAGLGRGRPDAPPEVRAFSSELGLKPPLEGDRRAQAADLTVYRAVRTASRWRSARTSSTSRSPLPWPSSRSSLHRACRRCRRRPSRSGARAAQLVTDASRSRWSPTRRSGRRATSPSSGSRFRATLVAAASDAPVPACRCSSSGRWRSNRNLVVMTGL